jgi:hypothetical protein
MCLRSPTAYGCPSITTRWSRPTARMTSKRTRMIIVMMMRLSLGMLRTLTMGSLSVSRCPHRKPHLSRFLACSTRSRSRGSASYARNVTPERRRTSTHPRKPHFLPLIQRLVKARERGVNSDRRLTAGCHRGNGRHGSYWHIASVGGNAAILPVSEVKPTCHGHCSTDANDP